MQIRKQADFVVSGTNGLLTSDFGSSTRGERHNSYYPHRSAHFVMIKISVGRDRKKKQLHLSTAKNSTPQWQKMFCLHGPISKLTDSFSKSSYSQDHLFWAWRHPHSSLISSLGFIMTMVIVISFAHDCRAVPNDYFFELLTRRVQSPTKLNDKI